MKRKAFCNIGLVVVSAAAWGTFFLYRTDNFTLMRVIHVLYFAPFTFLLLKSLESWLGKRPPVWVRWPLPVAIACLLEYIQRWTPPHNPEWRGLTASLLGVVIGVLIQQFTKKND